MPTTGAVASITAGAVSHAVSATLAATYEVGGAPSWPTAWGIGSKSAAGFTLTFPAPPPPAPAHAAPSLNLPTPYEISGAPSWVTAWSVGAKTASGFTLTFAAPCPAGGGTFDWLPPHPPPSGKRSGPLPR